MTCGRSSVRCPGRVIPKIIIKMVQTAPLLGMQYLGYEFNSTTRLYIRPGSGTIKISWE